MAVQVVLFVSITIQLIAAGWALRLTRLTGPQRAWTLIASAVVFMAVRRVITLYFALQGHQHDLAGVSSEVIGLITSVLMLLGIAAIEPLLRHLQDIQNELERRVAARTRELTQANEKLQAEITEREQIHAALQNSEARYRAIVNDQTDLICRYLPDRTLTFVNRAYCRMHGKSPEELIGHDFLEFVPEEDHERIQRVLALLTVESPVLVAEHHHTTLPKGENWRQWTRRATFDEQGRIVEIQAVGRDITRQRLMEEAVREREASLRLLVENLPVMVNALDEDGVALMWNRECERVTGYSADEIVNNPAGMNLLYPDPDYLSEMQNLYGQLGGDFRDWETTLTAKDGTLRIVAWSNVSERYPIPGWQSWAIGVDITRRKQIEKALHEAHEALERRIAERTTALRVANEALQREITERQRADLSLRTSQAMLRMTIDALADNVHVIDRDMRITLLNEAFRREIQELGMETRAIGRTPFEVFPFLGENVRAEYQQVFDTGETVFTEESTVVGSLTIYTETRKIPVFDGDQVTHVVTVMRDVTESKQAEEALRDSQRRYDLAAEAGQVGIWDWDLLTNAIYVEPSLKAMLGYTADEIQNHMDDWGQRFHPDDFGAVMAAAEAHFAGKMPNFEIEHRMLHKDGSVRWVLARGTAKRDEAGRAYRMIGTDTDITMRRLAEQEILDLALEKGRSEILAAFVQDVSHEFANPISVIKNSIYLALNTGDTNRRARHLEVVKGQVFHIEKLVEGLLTMSRLDSGFPFRCELVPLHTVLDAIYESLAGAAQQKDHTLVAEWSADLPPVKGDQKWLHLALRQVIDNAVQYTLPGGVITVRGIARNDHIVIEVSDTGIGIAPEHLDAIFQRFFRVERARTERGAGLGLPIARMIIERHGGFIAVESTPGEGSTFRVFLPISGC